MKLLTEAPVNGGPNYEGRALQGPSLNPAVCWNIRESSPTLPQGVGDNGRGADYQQETELFLRRKASGAAEDPQRLYAGEPCCKQFTVQGWKVLDCVKSLSNPSNPSYLW